MRMTFSDLISYAQGGVSDTTTPTKTFLKQRINERYQLVADKLKTFANSVPITALTEAGNQYYANPRNLKSIEGISVTVGSMVRHLKPKNSQEVWDKLNVVTVTSDMAEYYFRRRDDYGIWPVPSNDGNTISITHTQTAYPLTAEDYTTGTVSVSVNNQTVEGAGGMTWNTSVKAGYWFSLADTNGEPRGSWYRIAGITDADTLTLETYFEEPTETGAKYIIGETPEIPEEGHVLLGIGAIADFYLLRRKDTETGTRFNNMFWTGSPNIVPNFARPDQNTGGLFGLIASSQDRDDMSALVERKPTGGDDLYDYIAWGSTITE
jgi:hypothetical protein